MTDFENAIYLQEMFSEWFCFNITKKVSVKSILKMLSWLIDCSNIKKLKSDTTNM